jgi:hypothetical protein
MTKRSENLSAGLATYCKANRATSALVLASASAIALMAAALLPLPAALAAPVVIGLGAGLVLYCRMRRQAEFEERMRAADGGPLHQVLVNAVVVGQVRDADLASIEAQVEADLRTHIAQMRHAAHLLVLWPLSLALTAAPALAFWIVTGAALLAPDDLAQTWSALQTLHPGQWSKRAALLIHVLYVFSILVVGLRMVMGDGPAIADHFDKRVRDLVRQELGCAADGDVVFRTAGGTKHVALPCQALGAER